MLGAELEGAVEGYARYLQSAIPEQDIVLGEDVPVPKGME